MNKNNQTFLILVFALLFSSVSMSIIIFSDFKINVVNNVKKYLSQNLFNSWIIILFILNLFILVLILFLKNMKNRGEVGLKGDIGNQGEPGKDELCIHC